MKDAEKFISSVFGSDDENWVARYSSIIRDKTIGEVAHKSMSHFVPTDSGKYICHITKRLGCKGRVNGKGI